MSHICRLRTIVLWLAYCAGFFVITNAHADDDQAGKKLHDQHCLKCHESSVYQRPERFITSYKMLDQQIRRCEVPAGVQWSPSQITGVTDYLNSNFYKFNKSE